MTDTEKKAHPVNTVKSNASTKTATSVKSRTSTKTKSKPNPTQSNVNSADFGIKKAPCYIPLNLVSQCGHELVLYYNGNAPREAIFDCANARIRATLHLLEVFNASKNTEADTLHAVASAADLLLNDALTLLHELNPRVSSLLSKH